MSNTSPRAGWKLLTRIGLPILALAVVASQVWLARAQTGESGEIQIDGAVEGQTVAVAAPEVFAPVYSPTPPASGERRVPASHQAIADAANRAFIERGNRMIAASAPVNVAGPTGRQTAGPGPQAGAEDTFRLYRRTDFRVGGFTSSISEPAVAQAGRYAWYTWNWYTARSTNGGNTWSFTSPYADFSDFCCDQDAVYDRGRDIYIWYRQGVVPGGGDRNEVKISVSSDHAATWCTYTITPVGTNADWTNEWFDYPRMGLTSNYLYVTTNIFAVGGGFQRMLLMRWPLEKMKNCESLSFTYWTQTSGWTWAGIDQGKDDYFLLDHTPGFLGSKVRVWKQPAGTNGLNFVDKAVPGFTFANRNGTCTVPGGANPCARADSRVTSVTLRDMGGYDEIVGTWPGRDGGGFPFPYTEAASFRADTRVRTGRPLVWNRNYAWLYGVVGANDRGDMGLSVLLFRPSADPGHYVGLRDDYNPNRWVVRRTRQSTANWGSSTAGDYLRVKRHAPQGVGFVATGYYRADAGFTEIYTLFGRERDRNGILRFLNR